MPMKTQKTIVVALGGNSLLKATEKGTFEEQYSNLRETAEQLLEVLASGNRIVITHVNGPQIGNLLLATESARDIVPPKAVCRAADRLDLNRAPRALADLAFGSIS